VYKIVKKYDKTLQEKTLKEWLAIVDAEDFVKSTEPANLIDLVTNYVSRDKLLEWQRNEGSGRSDESDEIFPAVKLLPLTVSLLLFVVSFQFPEVDPGNPHANRCLSILVLAVTMWLSNALPYFATAMLVPVLTTSMQVLRDEKDPTLSMLPSESAKFVLGHFFNHTTVRDAALLL
jgi:phosphate transporter